MSVLTLLFRKEVFFTLIFVLIISILLHFFPLINSLGYEFSIVICFIISFVSVFLSSEIVSDFKKSTFFGRTRTEDVIYSVLIINILVLLIPFISATIGSSLNGYCSFKEGLLFFLLLPVITTIFSSALGIFCGFVFGKRGFFIGSILLFLIICYSLLELYYRSHLFFYNPVLGYFPGPIYDRIIPITNTLILYRLFVLAAGLFLLKLVQIIPGFKNYKFGLHNIFLVFFLLTIILFGFLKREELGFTYTRDFITENFLTAKVETDHFLIYYSPYHESSEKIALIAEDHEWRYLQLRNFLKTSSEKKIHSFIYPDENTRKKLIGAGNTTIANPIHGEIHLIYDSFPLDVLKHELVHVMAAEFGTKILRISPEFGLVEGIAVASDWDIKDLSRHKLSKNLIESGNAPEIKQILGIGFWYSSGAKSYTLMGSFCRYLIDTFGIEKFKEFYRTGKTESYEKSLDELVNSWKKFLSNIEINENEKELSALRFNDKGLFGGYCPREVEIYKMKGIKAYRNNRMKLASKHFNKAVNIDKDNPDLITFLAYSNYYSGDYAEFKSLINNKEIKGANKNIFDNLEANIIWGNGDFYQALSKFRELKNKSLPPDVLQEIDIKIYLENFNKELRDAFARYYTTRDKIKKTSILNEIINSYPDFSPAHYLLGRIYFNNKNYNLASKHFYYADSIGLPTKNLKQENLSHLGISHYINKRYFLAIKTFEEKLISDPDGTSSNFTKDFIKRSNWAINKNVNNKRTF